jgi:hypothetical protein
VEIGVRNVLIAEGIRTIYVGGRRRHGRLHPAAIADAFGVHYYTISKAVSGN